jgi:hypothetical protein
MRSKTTLRSKVLTSSRISRPVAVLGNRIKVNSSAFARNSSSLRYSSGGHASSSQKILHTAAECNGELQEGNSSGQTIAIAGVGRVASATDLAVDFSGVLVQLNEAIPERREPVVLIWRIAARNPVGMARGTFMLAQHDHRADGRKVRRVPKSSER